MRLLELLSSRKKQATSNGISELRKTEYTILDQQNQIYLDYTGGNIPPQSVLKQHLALLETSILGNPHSTNPTSQLATKLVEEARENVLQFFHAQDYICIFTQNASAALKIVGESYPFEAGSSFILTSDNHNSVNGIREFCKKKGGKSSYVTIRYEDLELDQNSFKNLLENVDTTKNNLVAFPAQSNVSGNKHDLEWIQYAQKKGCDVLLDAAAFVPTSKLDLSMYKPDFVSISFYKMFGYPTGIGCLLVKKTSFNKLQKPWFAGGTVTMVSVVEQNKYLANGHERFEDGTLNYMGIPAITFGLDYLSKLGYDAIGKHIKIHISYLFEALASLKYSNDQPVVKLFGPSDFSSRGGNIIVNFYDKNGTTVPFDRIETLTNSKNISIRSGCFCNPGIDEVNNCITHEEMSQYFTTREDGNYFDMMSYLGKLRGAIRISVGIPTTKSDLDAFLHVIHEFMSLQE